MLYLARRWNVRYEAVVQISSVKYPNPIEKLSFLFYCRIEYLVHINKKGIRIWKRL